MKKDIRMIAFDLDDTALDTEKTLRPAVADALREAAARGLVLVPATGRMLCGIPAEVRALPGLRYAVTSNGAKVIDLADGRALREDCFPKARAQAIYTLLSQDENFISVFFGETCYTPRRDLAFLRPCLSPGTLSYLQASRTYTEDLADLMAESPEPVEKFSVHYADREKLEAMRRRLSAEGDLAVTSSLGMNLEVNTKTASKGSALLWLAADLGFRPEQVMAVGDSSNDIDMLEKAGLGVAMGGASPEVLAAADLVAPGCDEDGLAAVVRKVLDAGKGEA